MSPRWVLRHQRRFNRDTRGMWDDCALHRARTTRLLLSADAPRGARLCVLGAGNCNDLDLPRLSERFGEIHLVDLDEEAIAFATTGRSSGGDVGDRVRLHGGVDVTGVADRLSSWQEEESVGDPSQESVADVVAAAREVSLPQFGGPFDVVLSACILTQLIDTVVHALGPRHTGTRDLALTVRDRHLRLLTELTRPGGRAILVTDTLSDKVDPGLPDVPEADLHAYLATAARENRCFTGANPAAVVAAIRADPAISETLDHHDLSVPWRWRLGTVTFLVYALRMRLRG